MIHLFIYAVNVIFYRISEKQVSGLFSCLHQVAVNAVEIKIRTPFEYKKVGN